MPVRRLGVASSWAVLVARSQAPLHLNRFSGRTGELLATEIGPLGPRKRCKAACHIRLQAAILKRTFNFRIILTTVTRGNRDVIYGIGIR